VRLSYVQGDVRFNRGNGKHPDLKKLWEQAEENLPIENNFALATGDGRAEIEFENTSMIYLAENSVVLFERLSEKDGVPETRLGIVSGTATIAVHTLPNEVFTIDLPTDQLRIVYPESSFIRIDSYLDGFAITPQADGGWGTPRDGHFARGQTLTYKGRELVQIDKTGQSKAHSEWDQWVRARFAARGAAMEAVLKASGLSSPIPGLTDLYASGTFSPCAPYGMCWEPSQQTASPPQALPEPATAQAAVHTTAQVAGQAAGKPSKPQAVTYFTSWRQCVSAYTFWAKTPDELNQLSKQADPSQMHEPWSSTVCHYGRWIFRDNRYQLVIVKKRHHHPPVRWVRVGKQVGFVPVHPADKKGKPPLNLKNGVFVVSAQKTGEQIERVDFDPKKQVATPINPPKEFRATPFPELAKAQPPEIQAHLLADVARDAKATGVTRTESKITYDYGKGKFVQTGGALAGHSAQPVVVGGLNSRGGFSGSGGGSSSGRSNGSGGGSGSHGGGSTSGGGFGGGSSGGGSTGGGSSSGGGGRGRP
jgi:hypothetical protein